MTKVLLVTNCTAAAIALVAFFTMNDISALEEVPSLLYVMSPFAVAIISSLKYFRKPTAGAVWPGTWAIVNVLSLIPYIIAVTVDKTAAAAMSVFAMVPVYQFVLAGVFGLAWSFSKFDEAGETVDGDRT